MKKILDFFIRKDTPNMHADTLEKILSENSSTGVIHTLRYNHVLYGLLTTKNIFNKDTFLSDLSTKTIYEIILCAKDYINIPITGQQGKIYACDNHEYMIRPISLRQATRASAATNLIMEGNYAYALYEFADCVSDYGKGSSEEHPKAISLNEHALYSCVIECFIKKIEMDEPDTNLRESNISAVPVNAMTEQEAKRLVEKGHTIEELIELFSDPQEVHDIYVNSGLMKPDFEKVVTALKNYREV